MSKWISYKAGQGQPGIYKIVEVEYFNGARSKGEAGSFSWYIGEHPNAIKRFRYIEPDIIRPSYLFFYAVALGALNAARGSGISGMKIVMILIMALISYIVFPSFIFAALFPLPILCWWWYGTGEQMPFVTRFMPWRAFEFLSLLVYSGVILTLAYYLG